MNSATITTSTVTLETSSGSIVPAAVTYTSSTDTATLTPTSALANSSTYTVVVVGGSSGVKDTNGNAMAANFSSTFTTSTPPTVTAVTPAKSATGIAVGTSITVTFSEAMNASTIDSSTIELFNPGGTVLTATVTYNSASDTATLTPSAKLANSTTYSAEVVGGSLPAALARLPTNRLV